MKLAKISPSYKSEPNDPLSAIDTDLTNLFLFSQGRVRFGGGGDGDRGENMNGRFQLFTTSATPDAENTVAHEMGSIPVGFLVIHQDKAGSLYQGPTTGTNWDATNAYLKCEVASVTFLVFFLQ
jgi:hypothetical protein